MKQRFNPKNLALLMLLSCSFMAPELRAQEPSKPLLLMEYQTSILNSEGEEIGSSSGHQSLIETVVKTTEEGTILHYDWPRDKDGKARSNFWYFLATVLEKPNGDLELRDVETVETRVQAWLDKYGISRKACGYWSHGGGFPFRVDCDPNKVLELIEPFDIRLPDARVGAEYMHPMASKSGKFEALPAPRNGLTVTLMVDEEKSRAEEAKFSYLMAQMMGEEKTREQAAAEAQKTGFSGQMTIEFDLDEGGDVFRRTDITSLTISRPKEEPETRKSVFTVERKDADWFDRRSHQ
jgi:hypothetical protein